MSYRKRPAVVMGAVALTLLLGAGAEQAVAAGTGQSGQQALPSGTGQSGQQALPSGTGQSGQQALPSGTGLDRFYGQKPAFKPCAPKLPPGVPAVKAECARLKVPLDYRNPKGKQAEIALLRVPARGKDPIGSLVLNPGGPGFPGTEHAALMAAVWAKSPITERFDLVGFDPRGVGASTPALDCYTDAERDRGAKFSSVPAGVDDWTEQETRRLVEQCAKRSGGRQVLAHVGTRDVARDMDVLRQALGDEKLSFAGSSYGTRLGAVYAEMFPKKVRALLLDAAFDPLAGTYERRVQQATGMQASFERMAASCATKQDCPLGTDPDRATKVFQKLVRPLIDKPARTSDGRGLTFEQAVEGVTAALYTEASWPVAIAGIAELKAGKGDTLLKLRDSYHGRSADGVYPNSLEATLTINCLDEERHTPKQESALNRAWFKAAPFSDPGRPIKEARDGCEQWPVKPTLGYPYATGIKGLADTLTVSVTRDPITPHEGGIKLAKTLGGSLLTVEGEQHGALVAGNACVNKTVATYLIDLKSPAEGARCKL
ncbi:alpha/beta hydrolase [Nonomuraea sp. NEAU-A123]|uniref:alpha/beta hydrolase n=1 Tax=Nonomuraea sp. NEAU-A123 TaxID=2839649 RepID=UPI001BE3DA1A|nr:alpha/beta hydrolase [Nonomuraea sp. NEAU-A123]MBT2229389.1 alpha/beta hydrolase [Nonomuraea sp. NEAU-A123]